MKMKWTFVAALAATAVFADSSLEWTVDQSGSLELDGTVTITVPAGKSVICSGVLSGTGKLVKEGAGNLTLSANNTYSGGTQINEGKLFGTSDNPFGSDHANNPIFVNTDLTDGRNCSSDTSTAVIFAKAGTKDAYRTYGYPITCSAWSKHGARPGSLGNAGRGSGTLYNIALGESYIQLTGDISGGDISIRCGTIGSNWAGNPPLKNTPKISGNVTAEGGTLALSSRAQEFGFTGVVKVGAVYHPISSDYPTVSKFSNAANEIGWVDCGRFNSGGSVTAAASGALNGAVLISTSQGFNKTQTANNCSQSFTLGNFDHTINYPTIDHLVFSRQPAESVGMANNVHGIACGKTLTMAATATATNDWVFSSTAATASLVWNPQGDFWLHNVSRAHAIGGTITVTRGGFSMDENCSFSNVTAIVVGENAVFSNACAFAGSLKKLTSLTLGAGAKVYLPSQSIVPGSVSLSLQSSSEVIFEEGTPSVVFNDVKRDGSFLPAGTFSPTSLPQVRGTETVVVANGAGAVDAVWDGGGGDDRKMTTAANWEGDVAPNFNESTVNATFATAGAEAVVETDTSLNRIVFDAPGDFTLSSSSADAHVQVMAGILGVDKPQEQTCTYMLATPLMLPFNQDWVFGTNACLVVDGPVSDLGVEGVSVTINVSCFNPIWFKGHGETGFKGTWNFPNRRYPEDSRNYYTPCVFATGVEPFGGSQATVSIAGGLQSGTILNSSALTTGSAAAYSLVASNATISSEIVYPYSSNEDRYGARIRSLHNTTNVFNGPIVNVRDIVYGENSCLTFNGPVSIHKNDIGTDHSLCFKFNTSGGSDANLKKSKVIFNGRVVFPDGTQRQADMNQMEYAEFQFNAASNVMARIGNASRYFQIRTGCDYAFAEGRTAIDFRSGGQSDLHLDGHSQHLGSLSAGHAKTEITTTAPCELRISQTNDVIYLGKFDDRITLAKDGAATLTWNQALGSSLRLLDGTLALASGVSAAAATNSVVTFAVGRLSLAKDAKVFKAYYMDADGAIKPLKVGSYHAGDGSAIGDRLVGEGHLVVKKSDIPSGFLILFK